VQVQNIKSVEERLNAKISARELGCHQKMTIEAYKLEKTLWTDADFERMDWHDNPVHAIAFGPASRELSLDIDYIFKWEQPLPGEKHYRFWISSTLSHLT
jgi:hypothetical protein